MHCDDYIDDPNAPPALRAYLERARSPAHGALSSEPYPTLFATYVGTDRRGGIVTGQRVRVVMASRSGDVGITRNLAEDHGYQLRCDVEQLMDFSARPYST